MPARMPLAESWAITPLEMASMLASASSSEAAAGSSSVLQRLSPERYSSSNSPNRLNTFSAAAGVGAARAASRGTSAVVSVCVQVPSKSVTMRCPGDGLLADVEATAAMAAKRRLLDGGRARSVGRINERREIVGVSRRRAAVANTRLSLLLRCRTQPNRGESGVGVAGAICFGCVSGATVGTDTQLE